MCSRLVELLARHPTRRPLLSGDRSQESLQCGGRYVAWLTETLVGAEVLDVIQWHHFGRDARFVQAVSQSIGLLLAILNQRRASLYREKKEGWNIVLRCHVRASTGRKIVVAFIGDHAFYNAQILAGILEKGSVSRYMSRQLSAGR